MPGVTRVNNEVAEVTQARLPPWPEDQAYALWSPQSRDEQGQQVSAALRDRIAASMRQSLGLTYPESSPVTNPPMTPDL